MNPSYFCLFLIISPLRYWRAAHHILVRDSFKIYQENSTLIYKRLILVRIGFSLYSIAGVMTKSKSGKVSHGHKDAQADQYKASVYRQGPNNYFLITNINITMRQTLEFSNLWSQIKFVLQYTMYILLYFQSRRNVLYKDFKCKLNEKYTLQYTKQYNVNLNS